MHTPIQYFKDVIKYAKKILEKIGGEERLPWNVDTNFSSEPFSELDKIINDQAEQNYKEFQNKNEYLELLTIMMRAIAQADPLLPIILFSSSGQRHILENVRGYGNIITGLEKPRFFGYKSGDASVVFLSAFKDAIDKAFTLLSSRVALKSINKVADTACVKPKALSNGKNTQQKDCYIEIFLDESEYKKKQIFSVGGMALLYKGDCKTGKANAERLHESMEKGSWKITLPVPAVPGQDNISTREFPFKWCGTGDEKIHKYLNCIKTLPYGKFEPDYEKNLEVLENNLLPGIISLKEPHLDNLIDKWFFFNMKHKGKVEQNICLFNENNLDDYTAKSLS